MIYRDNVDYAAAQNNAVEDVMDSITKAVEIAGFLQEDSRLDITNADIIAIARMVMEQDRYWVERLHNQEGDAE